MAEFPERFNVVALAAGSNITLLADQVIIITLLQISNGTFTSVTEVNLEAYQKSIFFFFFLYNYQE